MAEYTIVQVKRDSTLNWYASNPRLALGEPGVDMDLHRFKIGNGIDRWNELPYMDDDLYKLLDKQQQATADYVQALLNKIAANKLDADQKYNALTSEIRNTSRSLTERMTAVETGQTEYQENLTERQQEFEEAVTGDFEDTKAEVQAGLDEFNETRDSLTVRMNAIAGQATEDTEILDARVDAESRTHPNLGENIRNIHSEVLSVKQSGAKEKEERIAADEGERTERTAAYEAERTERITADEQHEAEIARLSNRAEKLSEHGEFLQEQIDDTAGGMLKTAILLSEEIQRTREETARREAEKTSEQQAREAGDSALSARIDNERRERVSEDERLSARIDVQSHELKHERLNSTEMSAELGRRIDELSGAVTEGALLVAEEDEKLKAERADRKKADEILSRIHSRREDYLQEQADDLADLVMSEILQNRKKFQAVQEDMQLEAHTRAVVDVQIREKIAEVDESHNLKINALDDEVKNTRRNLQEEKDQRVSQADEISDAVLDLAAEHFREHEKHTEAEKKLSERIDSNNDELSKNLRHEEQARKAFDSMIEKEIQPVAEAIMREGLDRYEDYDRLKKRLEHEEKLSALRDDFQNEQINELALTEMEQSAKLYREREQRRVDVQDLNEMLTSEKQARISTDEQSAENFSHERLTRTAQDEALQKQIDYAAIALLNAVSGIYGLNERLSTKIDRIKQSENINLERTQEQINDLIEAILRILINEYRARENIKARLKLLEQVLVDAGVLDESDIPITTETEIDSMFEDIFSGNTSGSATEPENEEEAEFLEDINNIFYP